MMRVASICTGLGLLDEGVQLAIPGAHIVAQADTDKHSQAFLRSRGGDPVGDLLEVDTEAEMLVAGFPCQPFSAAGKKKGVDDARWIWPRIAELIDRVRPALAFFENVPPLRSRGLDRVLGDLAARGFDAEWSCFPAAGIGAPHRRNRLWLLAYRDSKGLRRCRRALRDIEEGGPHDAPREVFKRCGPGVDGMALFPPVPNDGVAWASEAASRPQTEPSIRGVVDGGTAWTVQLKLLGNGVVPLAAAYALRALATRALGRYESPLESKRKEGCDDG